MRTTATTTRTTRTETGVYLFKVYVRFGKRWGFLIERGRSRHTEFAKRKVFTLTLSNITKRSVYIALQHAWGLEKLLLDARRHLAASKQTKGIKEWTNSTQIRQTGVPVIYYYVLLIKQIPFCRASVHLQIVDDVKMW